MLKKYIMWAGLFWIIAGFVVPLSAVAEKDTLIIGMQDETRSLDPAKAYEATSLGITSLVYERLVTFEADDFTQAVPAVAESWDIGPDGKTWTFRLQQGKVFASGNPLTADDVVFSLRRALKLGEGAASWLLTQFGLTEEAISKTDAYTVRIVLDRQYAPDMVLSCLAFNVASILDQKLLMEHDQNGDMGSAWLDEHSAGSGPFVLTERLLGQSYTLNANERYQGKRPQVKHIQVKSIAEPVEQAILLEKGEIDVAWDLQPDQMIRLEDDPDIQIYETPTMRIIYALMNQAYAPLQKQEVRDAIRYAIDYDGLIEFILQGAATKIQTFIPKGMLGYNPAMPFEYNPEKGKQLMAAAGYADGFDIELISLDYSPWLDVAIKIKSDLAKIGINVKLTSMPTSDLMKRVFARDTQLFVWSWLPDYVDPDANAKSFAHSDSAGDDATVKLLAWLSSYVNPDLAKLVEQASQELDRDTRKALYQEVTDTILRDGPFAVLYSPKKQYGVRMEVREWIGVPSLLWVTFPTLR